MQNITKSKTVRYFTRAALIEAANEAIKLDFNRQLEPAELRELPDALFPVIFHMPHFHRHFVPCEPHMRLMVELPADPKCSACGTVPGFIDVTNERFSKLPTRKL